MHGRILPRDDSPSLAADGSPRGGGVSVPSVGQSAAYADQVASRIPNGHRAPTVGSSADDGFFADALTALRSAPLRPELVIEEVPAPTRLAPHSVAVAGEVIPTKDPGDEPIGVGRFVLLFDPEGPEPWEGVWRAVTYAKTTMEPEVGADPLAGEVGWSWLTEALESRSLAWAAAAGTVTSVTSVSFGALADRETNVDLEIRASWTPALNEPRDLAGHLQAWGDLLCVMSGLPPLPEGVIALPGIRR